MKCSPTLLVAGFIALFGLPLLPESGSADSFGAIVIEGPIAFDDPTGPPNLPGGGHTPAEVGVLEEEFFFSGSVDVYTYEQGNVHLGQKVIKDEDVPYKTRMLVRRPFDAAAFNGTVVIESMNSTAGFDSTPSWLPSAEYFAREGIVYIGVTTSGNQAIPFLVSGCGGLAPPCGTRYASLAISDNGQEYELVNQLATALKTDGGPLPDDFGPVDRVFLTGQSQQGGSVITHASEFHFANIDGYFFMGASSARAISNGAPRLEGDERRVRTDLPVPVYRGSSEGDVGSGATRQDDTDTSPFASFRLIEVPGTSHNPIHKSEIFGFPLSFFCLNDVFSLADGPIFGSHVWNAMWENMRIQVDQGILPPYAPRIDKVAGVTQRDEFGNATGGVRLPEIDVPTNSYFSPNNQGKPICGGHGAPPFPDCIPSTGDPGTDFLLQLIAGLACRLNGSLEPLSQATLDDLYPNHGSYVRQIANRSNRLVRDRFLLPEDAELHKTAAGESQFGK
jgi:hypothetical protein